MAIPEFNFPGGCKINGNKEIFIVIAAEEKQLPHEQCGRREGCSVLEACIAEGQKHEKEFRSYKREIKTRSRLSDFQ